ncbi:MAG: glucokinase [Planctomycetota bacterium]|jgi:glucokinase
MNVRRAAGPEARLLAGIDIGGTKIGIAIGDSSGRVIASDRIENDSARTPEAVLTEALERLQMLCKQESLLAPRALGLACPGPLSYEGGCLLEVPNMPLWQGFGVLAFCRDATGLPVAMMNDANAGVLAEARWGAARGTKSAIFLTMSTGMGAGLWLDGRVYEGPSALAGEIGHIRLSDDGPVGFGKHGSVEGYLSGPGIEQVAQAERLAFVQAGRATKLPAMDLTPRVVCDLARAGDEAALATIDRCGAKLGQLCALLVDLLNPEVIVVGTIGSAYPDLWFPRARAVLEQEAIPSAQENLRLEVSGLSDRGNQTALAIADRHATALQSG